MDIYSNNSFLKSIFFSIIFLFSQISFGEEQCSLSSLSAESIRQIEIKIQERVKQEITSFLEAVNVTPDSEITVPVRIFNELQYLDEIPVLYPFISTSFFVHTTKQQTLCHSKVSNSICENDPKFEIYFDKILIRNEQGIPVKEECILSSQIIMHLINITKGYYLGATEIFRYNEPIYQWETSLSNLEMDLY